MMPEDLSDKIAENASGPASASGDRGSMSAHSPTQVIAADKHLASKSVSANPFAALGTAKIVPRPPEDGC